MPAARLPYSLGNLALTGRDRGLEFTLYLSLVGKQYIDNGAGFNPSGVADAGYEVDPYRMLNFSARYRFPQESILRGVEVIGDLNNVLNEKVLTYGNAGFGTPQFFPAAEACLSQADWA